MTEEKVLEEIKPFLDACDKMTASKFIMIDKRISDVLKSIAKTALVFEVVKECMVNFNFAREWKIATSKAGCLLPPEETHKFIAFVFSLLNCIDDKKISASDLLSKYYSKIESGAGPYSEFCDSLIVRFKDAVRNKILNKSDIVLPKEKQKIVVDIDREVVSRLIFLAKDLKDYVQGLKKIKKGSVTKGELIEIINGLICSLKNGDTKYVKAFATAIKAGHGKEMEIERRLVEILDLVNKTFIDA